MITQPGKSPIAVPLDALGLLVDSIRDYAIIMLDLDGRVATWNGGAEAVTGYPAAEIVGRHVSVFYPPEDAHSGKWERELETARGVGRFEEEGWRVRHDGSRFWANVVITPTRDAGRLLGYAKVTRDLTERREYELERVRLAQAEEAVRLRDEFLSIASHELKTPLSSLLLQLEGLRARLDGELGTRMDRAVRAADRLSQLIETLLDVSRIASGRFELKRSSFELGDAVREVVERMRDAATVAGCALTVHDAGAPIVGSWDRIRVEQIVINLVANAMKYAAGHPIELSVSVEDGHGVVRVRDHGPGIKATELDRVFGRFERSVSMRHYGGMGLGLYVVDQIAQAHGGSAAAANAPDGGALLTVRLPVPEAPG